MNSFRKILAQIFAGIAYAVLGLAGWKKKTVEANLKHVSQGAWGREEPRGLYKKMLKNLTRHVGELLFCFDTYKNLPGDCAAYPCGVGGCRFELAEGTGTVIEKMRKGGIFLTAHYGNYEASGAWLCALGVPLKASFIPLKPEWLNRHIYNKIRCVRGRPYSVDAKTPRDFLRILDGTAPDCAGQKQLFCLLADQDSRIPSALDGTFLGQPAKINPLPDFLLKHRPDTPVFFCWIEERPGKKILHAVEADWRSRLPGSESGAGSGRNDIVDGPYRIWLEARIKENPALWYGWTHRRFRSKNPEIYR
ncbi:MAG: lysophospholipid acyltransferase family protein [Fibrobacter sp.]|nr:lysophospholipid acyltransferase family protein [Fibrobacter sp.]